MKKIKRAKESRSDIKIVLKAFSEGKAIEIGREATNGNEKAEAVIAQYVHYLKFPGDKEREKLLCICFDSYEKSIKG